jgi:hypothetical protein
LLIRHRRERPLADLSNEEVQRFDHSVPGRAGVFTAQLASGDTSGGGIVFELLGASQGQGDGLSGGGTSGGGTPGSGALGRGGDGSGGGGGGSGFAPRLESAQGEVIRRPYAVGTQATQGSGLGQISKLDASNFFATDHYGDKNEICRGIMQYVVQDLHLVLWHEFPDFNISGACRLSGEVRLDWHPQEVSSTDLFGLEGRAR